MSENNIQGLVRHARVEAENFMYPQAPVPVLLLQLADALEYLGAELDRAKFSKDHTEQWYAVRLQWLEDWFRGPGKDLPVTDQFWHIIANGTPTVHTPPTYQQLLNVAKHRGETAEAALVAQREELDRLRARAQAVCDEELTPIAGALVLVRELAQSCTPTKSAP